MQQISEDDFLSWKSVADKRAVLIKIKLKKRKKAEHLTLTGRVGEAVGAIGASDEAITVVVGNGATWGNQKKKNQKKIFIVKKPLNS